MIVNFESSVVQLKDKLLAADKRKTQSESQSVKGSAGSEKKTEGEKQDIADVIGIRNENKLAAASNTSIQSKEEAFDILKELKKQFFNDSEKALNAHKKASADAVMQFYPFE